MNGRSTMSVSRRDFLAGLGASAALLPLLDAGRASAQGYPKRFIVFAKNNGMHLPEWFPSYNATKPPPPTDVDIATVTTQLIGGLPDRRKKDILLLGGLEHRSFKDAPFPVNGHHSSGNMLTGIGSKNVMYQGGGISLDQWLAQQITKTTTLAFPVLNLGVLLPGSTMGWMAYKGPDLPVTHDNDPFGVYARLFANATLPKADVDRIRLEKKSVLDYVGSQLTSFGKRLGTEDRVKIDYHLDSIRALESRLDALATAGSCAPPSLGMKVPNSNANQPILVKAQIDNIVAAMACDLTRVATLKIGSAGDYPLPWLSLAGPNGLKSYHDITHGQYSADFKSLKLAADRWHLEMFVYLLDKLDAVKEGTGTMLDSSVVLMADEMSDGVSHRQTDLPNLIAGRAGGRIKTGRYIHPGQIVPHNGVLVAIAGAMGFGVSSFGDPRYGGAYPGILS